MPEPTKKERYVESKKLLSTYKTKPEKLRLLMVEYQMDPEGYTITGMMDALADAMSDFTSEQAPTKKPRRQKKDRPPKPKKQPKQEVLPVVEEGKHLTGWKASTLRPGVGRYVVELLAAANEENPLSKKQLGDAICAKFPNREAGPMRKKAENCKTWILTHFGMEVSEKRTMDGKTMWITAEEYRKGLLWLEAKKAKRRKAR